MQEVAYVLSWSCSPASVQPHLAASSVSSGSGAGNASLAPQCPRPSPLFQHCLGRFAHLLCHGDSTLSSQITRSKHSGDVYIKRQVSSCKHYPHILCAGPPPASCKGAGCKSSYLRPGPTLTQQ